MKRLLLLAFAGCASVAGPAWADPGTMLGSGDAEATKLHKELSKEFKTARSEWRKRAQELDQAGDSAALNAHLQTQPDAAFIPRFIAAAEQYAQTDDAIPFLSWIVFNAPRDETRSDNACDIALKTLLDVHVESVEMLDFAKQVDRLEETFGTEECGAVLARLIEANRRDQQVTRYTTWAQLLDYCTLSANPVGELVLRLAGAATSERLAWSDAVCTALQVIEHSQDVREDCEAGRVYLPAEWLAAEGCPEADLVKAPASPALRRVVARMAGHARALLGSADPLVPSLHGPARLAVAGFVAGGHAALDALEAAGFDVTSAAVSPARGRVARRALGAWMGRGSR